MVGKKVRVELSVARLRKGRRLPPVCAAHGERATYRSPARYYSWPKPWVLLLLVIPVIGAPLVILVLSRTDVAAGPAITIPFAPCFLAWLATRSRLDVARWPYCDRCRGYRRGLQFAGLTVLGLIAAATATGAWLNTVRDSPAGEGIVFVAFIVGLPIMLGLLGASRMERRPSGMMSSDGQRLILRWVHPDFAEAAPLWSGKGADPAAVL